MTLASHALRCVPLQTLDLGAVELAQSWASELVRVGPEHRAVLWQQAVLAFERGEPDDAVRIFEEAAARRTDPWFDHQAGVAHMLNGDFVAARKAMERGLMQPGQETPAFDRERWPELIDYAYVLLRTGAPERAAKLIGETRAILQQQIDAGVVTIWSGPFDLQGRAALLHAMSGRSLEAVDALRRSAQ